MYRRHGFGWTFAEQHVTLSDHQLSTSSADASDLLVIRFRSICIDHSGGADQNSAVRQASNGFRISDFLLFEDQSCELVRRTAIGHIDSSLKNNRTVIVLIVCKVDRAPTHFDASLNRGFMDMVTIKAVAAERRNQRRMNIDDPQSEVVGDLQQTQKAREDDQIDLRDSKSCKDLVAEFPD